jgi:archaemetzincin
MPYSLFILPLGAIDQDILDHIRQTLIKTFQAETTILPGWEAPFFALSSFRNQFSAPVIIRSIISRTSEKNAKALGVTSFDLFAPRTNFVFGEAQISGPAAVISLYRLVDEDHDKYLERVGKEAVHEIGHTFGLDHCDSDDCVMRFSHNLTDTDAKRLTFCAKDLAHIKKVVEQNGETPPDKDNNKI